MNNMVEHLDNLSVSNNQLLDTWTLWAHLPHDTNWNLESYKQIMDITSLEEAIMLFENLPESVIKNCMLFVMRKGIYPTWEDAKNRDGGCFSYKINNKYVEETWKNLSYVLLGETLTSQDYSNNITGVTISPKKNFCIIKIWLSNCEQTDPNIINEIEGLTSQACIFKRHIE
jgi:hypothetical protein